MLKLSSNRLTPMIRSARWTILLKFRSEAALKKLSNLSLSLRRGPWLSKLDWWASIKALDDIYTKGQQTATVTGNYEDPCLLLWDSKWGKIGLCLFSLQCFVSPSHLQSLAHCRLIVRHRSADTGDPPTVQGEVLVLKLSFVRHSTFFFVIFSWVWIYIFMGKIYFLEPPCPFKYSLYGKISLF